MILSEPDENYGLAFILLLTKTLFLFHGLRLFKPDVFKLLQKNIPIFTLNYDRISNLQELKLKN